MFPKTCEWHLEWLSYGVYKHVIGENDKKKNTTTTNWNVKTVLNSDTCIAITSNQCWYTDLPILPLSVLNWKCQIRFFSLDVRFSQNRQIQLKPSAALCPAAVSLFVCFRGGGLLFSDSLFAQSRIQQTNLNNIGFPSAEMLPPPISYTH